KASSLASSSWAPCMVLTSFLPSSSADPGRTRHAKPARGRVRGTSVAATEPGNPWPSPMPGRADPPHIGSVTASRGHHDDPSRYPGHAGPRAVRHADGRGGGISPWPAGPIGGHGGEQGGR